MPTLEIDNFGMGVTDNYVNGAPNAAKKMDNLLINAFGKMVQRPGITIYNSSAPQIPPGNQRVDSHYKFDSTLFLKSGTKLYYIEDGDTSWTTLAGPTGNDAFADSELGAKCTFSEWRGHLFITPGPSTNKKGGCRTVKVYRNGADVWTLVQAGLPRATDGTTSGIEPSPTVSISSTSLVQQFRYIWQMIFVREYVARVNGVNILFKDYGGSPVIFETECDQYTDSSFTDSLTYANLTGENYDTTGMRVELFRTLADATEPLFSGNFALAAATTDDKTDDELGSTTKTITITVSTSGASGIFRVSTADAQALYVNQKVGLIDNDTANQDVYITSIDYATGDVTVSLTRGGAAYNGSAYTTAQSARFTFTYYSVLPPGYDVGNYNDPTPPCYFSTIADSLGWYGAAIDVPSGQLRTSRVLQSKPGDVDGVPSGNYVDVPGSVMTMLSHVGQHPVSSVDGRTYRIEGRYDAFGNGSLRAVLISDIEGAVSQDVVRTPFGVYFASQNGWCFTDAFRVVNLSKEHLRTTYAALLNKSKMSACYDAQNGRVHFGVESSSLVSGVSDKNNAAYVLDLARSEGQGVFTTASATTNFQPNALAYDPVNKVILIGDQRGYVFKFDSSVTTDPVVNTAVAYSTWSKTAIIWDWISCAFAFGSSRLAKWLSDIYIICKNLTGNLSMDLTSYKDDRTTGVRMKAVRDRSITSGLHKIVRRFPKGNLSGIYAALQIKKGLVIIARSDDYALATANGTANTAQVASGTWPNDGTDSLVGHSIYFSTDGYTAGWEISVQSGDTLTVLDTGNTFPTGSGKEWVIKGYPKNESVEIHAVSLDYDILGEGYPERSNQGGNT